MSPHVLSKIQLKQFANADDSVVVLSKSEMTYRRRGTSHSTFKASANYYGNGELGTLENELASKDESSITTIIDLIRGDQDLEQVKLDLHFLLWNSSARNPLFRDHPKVGKLPNLSSEDFHRVAMDSIKDEYLSHEVLPVHIKNYSNNFILPDFIMKYMVLAPDVAIIRVQKKDAEEFQSLIANEEDKFVENLNYESMQLATDWLVASSEEQFKKLGASKYQKAADS